LKTGDVLFIPGATRQLPVGVITPKSANSAPPKRPAPAVAVGSSGASAKSGYGFSWPLRGRMTARFGGRGSDIHDGIDIAANRGTSIAAARDGKVIYSDRLSGYGNVIILEHSGGFTSVYAHNDRNYARKGQRIQRGQKIAAVGSTGRATGPHLHFEIRKDNVARNPLYYLPK
jgi:murein DD-endopeptidase MepM/ murein hydrolase activator NlpD